jgi:hypothetical protein
MAFGNTPRRETNIAVEANKSFAFGILFKAQDGTPVDLSTSTLRFVAAELGHRGGNEVLSVVASTMDENAAMQQFEFQAEDLALPPGSYPYDVTLIPESGYSTPILKGTLEIGSNTDVDTSNVYTSDVTTGSNVTVYLNQHDLVEVTIERVDGLFMLVQELIKDFRDEVIGWQTGILASVDAAAASSTDAAYQADLLRGWFNSVGFPFWKGTQAEYDALPTKDPNVLYLITA